MNMTLKKLRLCLFPKTVYESPDKRLRVVDRIEDGHAVRILYDNGARESGIFLNEEEKNDPLFFYMRTLKDICVKHEDIHKALLIGGGGLAFAKYFLALRSENSLMVVEKDTRCIEIAKKFFDVEEGNRLNIHCMVGEEYISATARHNAAIIDKSRKILYDFVIFDAFVGNKPAKKLVTEPMLKLTKTLLTDEGMLAINVLNLKGGAPTMETCMTEQYLKGIFSHVEILLCENYGNSVILASDRELK